MPEIAAESPSLDPWEFLTNASFEIGGEDQMAEIRTRNPMPPSEESGHNKLEKDWREFIAKIQIRTGTLLKTDTVSFLLGAGASKHCGGILIGKIPKEVERILLKAGSGNGFTRSWLRLFYRATAHTQNVGAVTPITSQQILDRYSQLTAGGAVELQANYESLLSTLYRWLAVMTDKNQRLQLYGDPAVNAKASDLDLCLQQATSALGEMCQLPTIDKMHGLESYGAFCRKILTRPLNLKRVNIFTLNYDTLIEQACDAAGIVLVDGFVGTLRRVFRPECYDQDLYFPAQTTEGRVHRLDRVAHLYKLHGSINWVSEEPDLNNPYGVTATYDRKGNDKQVLIYPTPAKFGETLGMPYAEMFRRFASTVVRPQSTLFVLGYGFGDEHVNAIIRQAMAVPSFTLIIIDPAPNGKFVMRLKSIEDRRVWIYSGMTLGSFEGFVKHVLPDLQDEEVQRKVNTAFRELGRGTDQEKDDAK